MILYFVCFQNGTVLAFSCCKICSGKINKILGKHIGPKNSVECLHVLVHILLVSQFLMIPTISSPFSGGRYSHPYPLVGSNVTPAWRSLTHKGFLLPWIARGNVSPLLYHFQRLLNLNQTWQRLGLLRGWKAFMLECKRLPIKQEFCRFPQNCKGFPQLGCLFAESTPEEI